MAENFIEGFMNGAYIAGSIVGVLVIGFAVMGILTLIWALRDLFTKREKSRKWG